MSAHRGAARKAPLPGLRQRRLAPITREGDLSPERRLEALPTHGPPRRHLPPRADHVGAAAGGAVAAMHRGVQVAACIGQRCGLARLSGAQAEDSSLTLACRERRGVQSTPAHRPHPGVVVPAAPAPLRALARVPRVLRHAMRWRIVAVTLRLAQAVPRRRACPHDQSAGLCWAALS